MHEGDGGAPASGARRVVDDAETVVFHGRKRLRTVVDPVPDVMETLALVGEIFGDRRVIAGGREQLHVRVGNLQQRLLDTVALDDFPVLDLRAEDGTIELDRGLEIVDGDRDVIDLSEQHEIDCRVASVAVTSAQTNGTEAPPSATRAPVGRIVALAIAASVTIPLFILATRVIFGHWISFSDWSAIELRTRDVGTSRTPLVGPYSRYGWNHPGPLLYYALALPYRMLGSQGTGLLLGSLLINTGACVFIGVFLWRRGRVAGLLLGTVVVLLLIRALHVDFLVNPWNPYVIVLPMLALVLACWSATEGDVRWALPVATVLGSFAIQTHIGAVVGVVVPIAVAVGFCFADARRTKTLGALGKTVAIAFAAALICWIPPLVQQVKPNGGNLGDLWNFWTTSHPHVTGWSEGARLVNPQLAIPSPWFTGHEERNFFTGGVDPHWHVPIALILLIGAFVLAWRRHDRQSLRLCTFALALLFAAFVAASRIVDTPFVYVMQWLWIVGAVLWLAILWTALRAFASGERTHAIVSRALAAAAATLVVVLTIGAVRASFPNPNNDERSIAHIAPAVRNALRALPQPILLETPTDLRSGTTAAGVQTIALHDGIDVRLPPGFAYIVGDAHTTKDHAPRSTIVVAVDDAANQYRNDPSYLLLAEYDPLTPQQRAQREQLRSDALAAQGSGPYGSTIWFGTHPHEAALMRSYDRAGPRIDVYQKVS